MIDVRPGAPKRKGHVVRLRSTKRILFVLLTLVVALAAVTVATAAEGDDKVVFTVGLVNDYDTLNPAVGVEVPDYEVWNIQYATLTDKSAEDFATIPGFAESWEESNDGKTYTYVLREGLEWSDGTPLTAEDIAYTVNRSREEEWLNYDSTVQNLTAKVIDDTTVEIASSVPDPKLPAMDVYILPKHVIEQYDAKAMTKWDGITDVGSGPFTLTEAKRGQFWTMTVNPSYWGWQGDEPPLDEVVFRLFSNADAMVAALERGEIDAAHDVPAESFEGLSSTEGIVALQGEQGGFTEIAVNGGRPDDKRVEGIGNGNPALSDVEFRKAIAHAIDKQTMIDRVSAGLGRPATTISPSANPEWIPEIPEAEQYTFDLEKSKQILDAAGYEDTNGNGIREVDGKDVNLTYYILSDSTTAAPNAEFVTGWLKEVGIGTTVKTVSSSKLTEIIGKGDYDMFQWGWTPFVDPDPMLSYFTCDQLSSDPDNPTDYYNDANWCDPAYDADYKLQNVELDREKRIEIVHRMLRTMYDAAVYNVVSYEGDLQAYRTDRFEGWLRQPAEIGPVLFSNTSPTYANLTVAASAGDSGGGGISTAGIVAIAVAGVLAVGLVVFLVGRRRSAGERE
jgi:peptide/nickel transport system substrate-binding protein